MLSKILVPSAIAVVALLVVPANVDGWGAAHVGVTRVGPGGVYHAGRTVAAGPGGVYAGGRAGAVGYGGAAYGYRGGAVGYRGGAAYGYRGGYAGGYGGAAGYRYGYIR